MRRKLKQAVALVCAVVMAISGCLIENAFTSKANETETHAVIKYSNPGIGVNVGETISLSKYAVEFADGVKTEAKDVEWVGQGRVYKVPFASPAIPAIAGEALNLSQYKVQFTEGGDYLVVDTWTGVETVNNVFTPEKGVYQLTATAEGQEPKKIYVVATDATDEEYVLYFNDFGEQYADDVDADGVIEGAVYSYNDFINKNDVYYMTKVRQGASTCKYIVKDGKFYMYRDVTNYTTSNTHLLLPDWLGDFGNYKIEMRAGRKEANSNGTLAMIGIDIRANMPGNIEGTSNTNESQGKYDKAYYLENNYFFGIRADGQSSIIYTANGQLGDNNITVGNNTIKNCLSLVHNGMFVATVQVKDNTVEYSVTQKDAETQESQTVSLPPTVVEGMPTTGRIGIYGRYMRPEVDYIKVTLVDKLEYEVAEGAAITSFTPETAGVHELTVKNKKTDAVKTIYVIAKEESDTEYVLYENNFDSEADLAELIDSNGATTTNTVAVKEGQMKVTVGASTYYKINDAKLQNFGNYRIEMTATTDEVSNNNNNNSDGLGLFARQTYDKQYSVRLKYKYFDSDAAALSFDTQVAWGKYAYTFAHVSEEYVHSMLVQEDLIEYKVTNQAGKTGTILYDVRDRELKTGDVGIRLQHTTDTTYNVSINQIRVLFCPDETAPNAPVQAKYTRTTSLHGMADGTITVNLATTGSQAKDVVCYWGDAKGVRLAGYANFSKVLVPDGAMTVTVDLGSNIMVPQGAEKLLVYTENHMGLSEDCVVIDLSEKLSALSLGSELKSFQVVSDFHIEEEEDYASDNLKEFLKNVLANDSNTSGIFVGGDLVDSGAEDEYKHLNEIYASYTGLPRMYSIIGNHEFWFGDASADGWQANMNRYYEYTLPEDEIEEYGKPYYARDIDGVKFIFLNSDSKESEKPTDAQLSDVQVTWLEEEMAKTEAGKPTFVFLHQPLAGTVVGSTDKGVDKSAQVQAILAKYPQAILFTSHSHVDLDQPGTMIKADGTGCNMFNTAAVAYLMNNHYTSANMTYDGAQGYYVEVYADKVLVRGKNLVTNEWMPSAQFVVYMEEQEDEALLEDAYDFTEVTSVGYLDDAFSAYQYNQSVDRKSSYAVADDKVVADYFQLDNGLMATSVPENGYTVLTYNKADLKNFEAEYTISNVGDAATGLIFGGQPGVLPITFDDNADNDTGVAIYMTSDGAMYVYGAVDAMSATSATSTLESGTKAKLYNIYPSGKNIEPPTDTTYVNGASYIYAPAIAEAKDIYTICVKVSNGRLTVYEKSNHKNALTVDLTDLYKSGYVSLFTTSDEQGRFEYFEVNQLKAWDYDMSVAYGGNDTAYLDDAFDAYFYNVKGQLYSAVHGDNSKTPVEPSAIAGNSTNNANNLNGFSASLSKNHFGDYTRGALKAFYVTSKNASYKTLGGNSGSAALTYTKHLVRDFQVEYDFFPHVENGEDVRNGLIFGGVANTLSITRDGDASNDIGVALYMTHDGTLYVYGAIDVNKTPDANSLIVERNQDTSNVDGTQHVVVRGMTNGKALENHKDIVNSETPHYTMCVKVKEGFLSVFEKNNPDRVAKIALANTYQGGNVSLFTNSKNHGGFGGFRIKRLENYDFTGLDLTEVDNYFDSYQFTTSGSLETKGKSSTQWKISEGTLMPTGGNITTLVLNNKQMTNFEASTTFTFTKNAANGIMIAPEGKVVCYKDGYKKNPGGVLVSLNGDSKQLFIYGAVDAANAEWTGTIGKTFSTKNGYVRTDSTGLVYGQQYVLHMKVENGVVSAWVDGLEGKLSVKLNGNYVGGNVSLYAKGNTSGFAKFNLTPLSDATATTRTELPIKITPISGGAQLTISTDVAESKLQGVLHYNQDAFSVGSISYADENTQKLNTVVGTTLQAQNGELSLDDMLAIATGKVLTINLVGNSRDYSSIYVENPNVVTAGGRDVARVDCDVTVSFDYKADQKLDAIDLVRGKLNEAEGKGASVKALRRVIVGEPISIVSEDFTFELPSSGDKVVTLGNSGSTTIYTDCTITVPNSTSRIYCDLLGPVTLDGVTLNVVNKSTAEAGKGGSDFRILANGYDFIVNENVKFTEGSFVRTLYGGSRKNQVASTNVTLLAGTYLGIYGGGCSINNPDAVTVNGDTNLYIGGTVNSGINPWSDAEPNKIYAAGYDSLVLGDTHVTIAGNAKADRVYGGGYSGAAGVNGTCHIDIKGGEVMGYIGGNRGRSGATGTVKHTEIVMTGGKTWQIFGGSEVQSMAEAGSSTNVTITGGTIMRRIYGGCYNEGKRSLLSASYETTYHVNGTTNVTIGGDMEFNTSSNKMEYAICAVSRHNTNFDDETSTLTISTSLYNQLRSYIEGTLMVSDGYDRLVKTN